MTEKVNEATTTPLREQDFIHEGYAKNPSLLWIWLALIAALICLLWGGQTWRQRRVDSSMDSNPFLQVTNREFSLFLWQHPEYMRIHVKNRSGYLPGFQYMDKIGVDPQMAEQYVVGPPQVIFLYHAWRRLIGSDVVSRKIPVKEFREFTSYAEEWQPKYWPAAPAEYVKFMETLEKETIADLQTLPLTTLPHQARLAFQGWKNYFKEGDLINAVKPTYAQLQAFLAERPHYARQHWRDILKETPNYLLTLSSGTFDPEAEVPSQELAPFLKAAFFNFQQVSSLQHPRRG